MIRDYWLSMVTYLMVILQFSNNLLKNFFNDSHEEINYYKNWREKFNIFVKKMKTVLSQRIIAIFVNVAAFWNALKMECQRTVSLSSLSALSTLA